jgi:hypothetical protein
VSFYFGEVQIPPEGYTSSPRYCFRNDHPSHIPFGDAKTAEMVVFGLNMHFAPDYFEQERIPFRSKNLFFSDDKRRITIGKHLLDEQMVQL